MGRPHGHVAVSLPPIQATLETMVPWHGHRDACLAAIRDCWANFLADHSVKTSQCLVPGLFPEDAS